MNDLTDLSPLNKEVPLCTVDLASEEERKKGIHDQRTMTTYPAYPWRFDGTDHSKDNAKVFCDIAKQSGIMRDVRAENKQRDDRLMTYSQWLEKHKDEPGFVNHIAEVVR